MSIADDARDPSSSSIGAAGLFVGSLKACFLRTRIVTMNLCGAVFSQSSNMSPITPSNSVMILPSMILPFLCVLCRSFAAKSAGL